MMMMMMMMIGYTGLSSVPVSQSRVSLDVGRAGADVGDATTSTRSRDGVGGGGARGRRAPAGRRRRALRGRGRRAPTRSRRRAGLAGVGPSRRRSATRPRGHRSRVPTTTRAPGAALHAGPVRSCRHRRPPTRGAESDRSRRTDSAWSADRDTGGRAADPRGSAMSSSR